MVLLRILFFFFFLVVTTERVVSQNFLGNFERGRKVSYSGNQFKIIGDRTEKHVHPHWRKGREMSKPRARAAGAGG